MKKILATLVFAAAILLTTTSFAAEWQFGAGGSLSSMSSVFSENTTSAVFGYSGGIGIEGDVRLMEKDSWGFQGGLTLNSERTEDSLTITSGGVTISGTSINKGKVRSNMIYANAVYQWDIYYLPFGLNIASFEYSPAVGTGDAKGGLGYQIGSGWYLQENLPIEIWLKSTKVTYSRNESGTNLDFGNGTLVSFAVALKYIF